MVKVDFHPIQVTVRHRDLFIQKETDLFRAKELDQPLTKKDLTKNSTIAHVPKNSTVKVQEYHTYVENHAIIFYHIKL